MHSRWPSKARQELAPRAETQSNFSLVSCIIMLMLNVNIKCIIILLLNVNIKCMIMLMLNVNIKCKILSMFNVNIKCIIMLILNTDIIQWDTHTNRKRVSYRISPFDSPKKITSYQRPEEETILVLSRKPSLIFS